MGDQQSVPQDTRSGGNGAENSGSHGHSHGGKPCHGHGGQSGGHGHSHAGGNAGGAAGHGHSHGGKPCHGHGHGGGGHDHGHGGPAVDPMVMRRKMATDLYLKAMLRPKLPLVFAHFHASTAEEKAALEKSKSDATAATSTSAPENPSPDASATAATAPATTAPATTAAPTTSVEPEEVMNRAEFRKFVYATQLAAAQADGHSVVRPREAGIMETQFLRAAGVLTAESQPDEDVKIPKSLFIEVAAMIMSRICMTRPDTVKYVVKEWGVDVKTPHFPLNQMEEAMQYARDYARTQISPALAKFISEKSEANKEVKEEHIRSGFQAVVQSVVEGLTETKANGFFSKRILEDLRTMNYEEILPLLKVKEDDEHVSFPLMVSFICNNFAAPLLQFDPQTAPAVLKRWGVELVITTDEEDEAESAPAHGHSHGGKPCHGHGGQAGGHGHSHGGNGGGHGHSHGGNGGGHGHSHGGKPCHGHGGHGH